MHGFITIISRNLSHEFSPIKIQWKKPFDFQTKFIHRKLEEPFFQIEQFTSSQIINKKIWIENNEFLCVIEGLVLNINDFKCTFSVDNDEDLIRKLSLNNDDFFKNFEGSFTGIFHDKRKKSWLAFNNQTATKRLYYFQNDDYLIISTDLFTLSQSMKALNIKRKLDENGAYLLLSAGYMMKNYTLIENVYQIGAGEFLKLKDNEISIHQYFHLNNIQSIEISENEAIKTLDEKFKKAVKLGFDFDKKNNLQSYTTISGGLDSRMTALVAYKTGFKNQILFNYSKKGYADEVIAKKIAKKYNFQINNYSITPQSLTKIDDVIAVNDGLISFTGCSHFFDVLPDLCKNNTGIIHTGMIGDAVLGSFVTAVEIVNPKISDGIYSTSVTFKKAEDLIRNVMNDFTTEEIYKYYHRAFMGANSGFLYFDLIGEAYSPFLNTDFLSFAYSLPRKYKLHENLYVKWIKTLYPDIASFTWESIGGKPTNNLFLRKYFRIKRAIIKRLPIKTMWKENMAPEQKWLDDNIEIKKTFDTYFTENIHLVNAFPNLKKDIETQYKSKNISEKAQCITLLGAAKLLLNDN